MRDELTNSDGAVALPSNGGGTVAVPDRLLGVAGLWVRARALVPARLGRVAGWLALTVIVGGVATLIAYSTAGDSMLVPRSGAAFPAWESGPLHGLFGHPWLPRHQMVLGYSGLIAVMALAWGVALLAARSVSMRVIAIAVVACNLILLMGPPLQLNDVFNYLGYARLGALHGLNPYTHVIGSESFDPVFRFTSWWNLSSPYGPLFTVMTYPLAWLPLPAAFWALKVAVIAASLGFIWCIARCARLLGRDPRSAVLFVAANPVFLFYELAGFHNDMFMLLPSTAAIALLVARRDRAAGAMLMVAVAIKMTTIVLLPFLLMAARPAQRRLRVLTGVVAAAVPLGVMTLVVFGGALPNLSDQSGLVTGTSIPNLLGLILGLGGSSTSLVRLLNVGVALVVLAGLRRRDWVGAAGWAQLALVASIAWLMPWYIVWVLPLAALGNSRALRRVAVAMTLFLIVAFAPETGHLLSEHRINLMDTPQGQAAQNYQQHLQR